MRKNLTFNILFKLSLKKLRMADDYPGPHCARQGISTHWLISLLTNPNEAKKIQVVQNPELLVGKRVVHYFKDDGICQGYHGLVTGLVPGTTTWFNISYDDEDDIPMFELLDDYRDGDLEILSS